MKYFNSKRELLQYLLDGGSIVNGTHGPFTLDTWFHTWTGYARYEAPNPHAEGSFLWAKFEADRGHRVTCDLLLTCLRSVDASAFTVEPNTTWSTEYIVATDWRIVK